MQQLCDELLNKEINYKVVCCRGYNNASKCWRHYVTYVKSVVYKSTNYEDDIQLPHQLTQHEDVNSSSRSICEDSATLKNDLMFLNCSMGGDFI